MRTERVEIKLSPDEKRRLTEAARSEHLPLATWIRVKVMALLEKRPRRG